MKRKFKYFFYEAINESDFLNIQITLFEKGYSWLNDDNSVFNPSRVVTNIKYPLYLTNLPNNNGIEFSRSGKYFYFAEDKNDINFLKLRIEKLKKINAR